MTPRRIFNVAGFLLNMILGDFSFGQFELSEPESNHVPDAVLISQDVPPDPFFSGGVPRTTAIGDDATLHDVGNVGQHCWAVGDHGVVCQSEDSGKTWTTMLTPLECSLRSVCFLTNRIGWIAGYRILPGTSRESAVLLQTRDGGVTWRTLSSDSSRQASGELIATSALPGILHVQYFGLTEAIAVTLPVLRHHNATVFRSEDGGQHWSPLSIDRPGSVWNAGQFLSLSEGVVVGQHQSYGAVVSDQTVVINSPQPTLRQLRSVSLDAQGHGWIVGDGAMLLKTANSGVTWQAPGQVLPREISEVIDLHTVAHRDENVLLAGNPAGCVFRSSSAGDEWKVHSLPASGRINRLRFLSDTVVLAVGSFGQILRSADAGTSWQSVRSTGYRAGILNLVTDADKAAWRLLSNASAEVGLRSVTLQLSQPLEMTSVNSSIANTMTSNRSQWACSQIGGNDSVADWMFPRTKPEQHLTSGQLISEWNRQSDGQLRKLLPLRLARDLRNWKPTTVVIEQASDDDAVAALVRDVITRAIELAAEEDSESEALSSVRLAPWYVDRVINRVPVKHQASMSFGNEDLLPALGTTTGLLCDTVSKSFPATINLGSQPGLRASYEVLMDRHETVAIQSLLDGLEPTAWDGARRARASRTRQEISSLRSILQKAHIEGSAIQGMTKLGRSEESLTAELRNVGANLPQTLAARQLKDLADLNLQQNNIDGYFSVLQEITRRYPTSEEGYAAAEALFLFYSSSEVRYFRMKAVNGSSFVLTGKTPGESASVPDPANREADAGSTVNAFSSISEPKVDRPASQVFSSDAGDPAAALQERWDHQAAQALRILSNAGISGPLQREVNPMVQLRHAANQRLKDRHGEFINALAELSQSESELGEYARSEMQLNAASAPSLLTFNLPRRTERPFLDGQLTDAIWESAEELSLKPFEPVSPLGMPVEFSSVSGGNDDTKSLAMLAWDEEFLYFAARFARSAQHGKNVQLAAHRSHDSKHEDRDRFEIELDTDRDYITSFQLSIDESGLTSDRCWMLDRWNPKWFVAVDADENTWRLEAAIPLSELTTQPAKPGDIWSIRLRRIIPGVLQHELPSSGSTVSTRGAGLVRFIRAKPLTGGRRN